MRDQFNHPSAGLIGHYARGGGLRCRPPGPPGPPGPARGAARPGWQRRVVPPADPPDDIAAVMLAGLSSPASPVLVVLSARGDENIAVFVDAVDETVLLGDAAGPVSGEVVAQRFRPADAGVPIALDIAEEPVDALENPAIPGLPPQVFLPGAVIPDESHISRSRSQ